MYFFKSFIYGYCFYFHFFFLQYTLRASKWCTCWSNCCVGDSIDVMEICTLCRGHATQSITNTITVVVEATVVELWRKQWWWWLWQSGAWGNKKLLCRYPFYSTPTTYWHKRLTIQNVKKHFPIITENL